MKSLSARTQYQLGHADLSLILALVRGGSLARAAALLKLDVSSVFRAVRKLEAALGIALFDKSRSGYLPTDAVRLLASHAELAEQALEAARLALEQQREIVTGTVRITCTEAVLHGLLLPALQQFMADYPGLTLELVTSNEFANLSRRDADIALRLTHAPPEHLVGRCLGSVAYQLCGHPNLGGDGTPLQELAWAAPDDFLPDHPTVVWRKQHYPSVQPRYRCNSIAAVAGLVAAGLAVGAIPDFMADTGTIRLLPAALADCNAELWLLTRPDCRNLRSVALLFDALGRTISPLLPSAPR